MSRGRNGQWNPKKQDGLEHFKAKVMDYLT